MLSIISTVGMTVFGGANNPLDKAFQELEKSFGENTEQAIKEISDDRKKDFPGREIYQQAIKDLEAKGVEFLRSSCAEINGIEGIHEVEEVRRGNAYYFMASHTLKGVLAARILTDFCKKHYDASESKLKMIHGLQVKNERDFRLTGLPFLVQEVYQVIDDSVQKGLKVVINPTGGYKAVIPYMTLIGMLRDKPVHIIHETSHQLITLSSLPITLDLERINEIHPLLKECYKAQLTGLDKITLHKRLKLAADKSIEDHPLWSLFEQFDSEHYILSGLGDIARIELDKREQIKPVWLSKQASDRFDKLDLTQQKKFGGYFEQSRDKNWIDQKRHDEYKNPGKAICIKPGNVNERLFIYESDTEILIAEIAFHKPDGSYDTVPKSRQSYTNHRLWKKD